MGECPPSRLVLADTGLICPGWSCPQLCQNLGGERADGAAGAGTTWGMDNRAQQTPLSEDRARRVGCMEGKQSLDIPNVFD